MDEGKSSRKWGSSTDLIGISTVLLFTTLPLIKLNGADHAVEMINDPDRATKNISINNIFSLLLKLPKIIKFSSDIQIISNFL